MPVGSGIVAIQDINMKGFRIAGTGEVVGLEATIPIVKKLRLVGNPLKIHRNSANIKDMFNSDLEVAKFAKAKIKTVSGIRGTVKRAVGNQGEFRASFEDKILMSDIVFMNTWIAVEINRFFNPIQSRYTKQLKSKYELLQKDEYKDIKDNMKRSSG
jgi:ribosome biogenesis protein BMS1